MEGKDGSWRREEGMEGRGRGEGEKGRWVVYGYSRSIDIIINVVFQDPNTNNKIYVLISLIQIQIYLNGI